MKPSERIYQIMYPNGLTAMGGQISSIPPHEAIMKYLDEQATQPKGEEMTDNIWPDGLITKKDLEDYRKALALENKELDRKIAERSKNSGV